MEIILYTTHCPQCKLLEKTLKDKNIEYKEETNVDTMLSLGIQAVPILQVDDKKMNLKEALTWVRSN